MTFVAETFASASAVKPEVLKLWPWCASLPRVPEEFWMVRNLKMPWTISTV